MSEGWGGGGGGKPPAALVRYTVKDVFRVWNTSRGPPGQLLLDEGFPLYSGGVIGKGSLLGYKTVNNGDR